MSETTEHTQLRSSTDSTDGVVEQVVETLLSADQVVQTDSRLRTVGGRVFLVCAVVISASLLALELYRVLKGDGTLSMSDHHMKEPDIMSQMTASGYFKLLNKGKKVYNFSKVTAGK